MTRHWFRKRDGKPRAVGSLFDDAVVMLEDRVMLDAATPVATVTAATQTAQLTSPDNHVTVHVLFDNASDGTGTNGMGANATGYGPFLQVIVPTHGVDGPAAGAPDGDGLKFNGASYLGTALAASDVFDMTFTSVAGVAQATNPLTNQTVLASDFGAVAGDHFVVLRLPFGSFTPPQTKTDIALDLTLSSYADLGVGLPVKAVAGFQYGTSPTGNTPIVQAAGSAAVDTITPTLLTTAITTDTEANTSEEVATGPNQAYHYTLHVDIATGQTITDGTSVAIGPTVTATLPDTLVYLHDGSNPLTVKVGATTLTASDYTIVSEPTPGSVVTTGHNTLAIRINNPVTGIAGDDITVTYGAYVNDVHGNGGAAVLTQPSNFAATPTQTDLTSTYHWNALDARDNSGMITPTTTAVVSDIVTNRPIAIQKSGVLLINADGTTDGSGNPTLSSGDTILYTLNVQVSDYHSSGEITITDVLSDGQRLDTTTAPTISLVQRGGAAQAGAMAGVGVPGTPNAEFTGNFASSFSGTTGLTTSMINVSAALIAAGFDADGVLAGGRTQAGDAGAGTGGTTFAITFRAVVQNNFVNPSPGNAAVDQGDTVGNTATISSSIRNNLTPATTPFPGAVALRDDASASLPIVTGGLIKTIYAITSDGVTTLNPTGNIQIKAGDTITYRLRYALPLSSFENLSITDFLPLPVLVAQPLTLNTGTPTLTAGELAYTPNNGMGDAGDTFHLVNGGTAPTPMVTPDTGGNSIKFDYGSYSLQNQAGNTNAASTIDLLFTVAATDTAFADGLYLTNLASSTENNTAGSPTPRNSIVQIQLSQPRLLIQKAYVGSTNVNGVVVQGTGGIALTNVSYNTGTASGITFTGGRTSITDTDLGTATVNATAAAPNLNSDITKLDGGDVARVALVINNEGSSAKGAFDVIFGDTLATSTTFFGGAIGTAHLVLTRGDGTVLTENTGGGGDYTVTAVGGNGFTVTLANGLAGAGNGAIAKDGTANGADILIATYDVKIDNNIALPSLLISSPATLTHFSAFAGGVDIADPDLSESASIAFDVPTVDKSLQSPGAATATTGYFLTVGESATYRVTYHLADGTYSNAQLLDFLPTTYDVTGATFVSASSGVSVGGTAITDNASLTATFGNFVSYAFNGYNYGGFTGNGAANGTGVTLLADGGVAGAKTIVVDYMVRANTTATVDTNGSLNKGDFHYANTDALGSSPIDIRLPKVNIVKSLDTPPGSIDAGDTVTFTVTATHVAGSIDAYDVDLSDILPAGLSNLALVAMSGSGTGSAAGFTNANFSVAGGNLHLTAPLASMTGTDSFTVKISATVDNTAPAGGSIINTANVIYTTLPGADPNEKTFTGPGSATVPIAASSIVKSIQTTSVGNDTSSTVVIGETVTFDLLATIPEGNSNTFTITDTLPSGLVFVSGKVISIGDSTTAGATSGGNISGSSLMIGQTVASTTFGFGNLTNNPDGAVTAADKILVRVTARVADVVGNATGTMLVNSVVSSTLVGASTVTSTPSTATVTVAVPDVTIAKTIITTPSPLDAGGTVGYQIVVTNPTATAAYDLALSDTFTAGALNSFANLTVTDATPSLIDESNGGAVTANGHVHLTGAGVLSIDAGYGLAAGKAFTISYTAKIADATVTNSVVRNTTGVGFSTLSGSDPFERSIAATSAFPLADPAHESTVTFTTAAAQSIVKTITGTSPAIGSGQGGAGPDLVVGATGSFKIVVTLPEGTTNGVTIADILQTAGAAGTLGKLKLVGTPTVAFGDVNASFTGAGTFIAGADTDGDGNPDSFSYNFGNVTIPGNNDATDNTITITYQATLLDVAANAAGNQAMPTATLTSSLGSPTSGVSYDIVQPDLTITKTVDNATAAAAGDRVTYTTTLAHSVGSSAAAQDVVFTDLLGNGASFIGGTVLVNGVATVVTASGSGFTLHLPSIALGTTTTVVYQANISAAAQSTVTTTAQVDFDGIASAGGVPGTDGQNDRDQSHVGSVSLGTVGIAKSITATSLTDTGTAQVRAGVPDLAIGETATFQVVVDVPAGARTFTVKDLLDLAGVGQLTLTGAPIVSQSGGVAYATAPVITNPDNDGDGNPDYSVAFSMDATSAAGKITITYTAVVPNVAANASGDQLNLPVTLAYATPAAGIAGNLTSSVSVDIVEPVLSIDKQITTSDATPNAGDTVTYKVIVTNTGNGPAYGVNISDPLPAGLTYSGSPSLVLDMGGGTTTPGNAASVTVATILPGQTATLTYSATIDSSAVTGVPINNTATVAASGSTPGGGGRPGAMPSDSTSFTVEALQGLNKAISATSDPNTGTGAYRAGVPDLHVGETATVDLTVRLTEGTTGSVVLVDKLQLPAGTLTLTAPPTIVTANGVTFTGTGAAGYTLTDTDGDGVADTITMNFGSVTVPGNNDTTDNFFVVRYTALVGDRPENQAGKQIDLGATLTTALGTAAAASQIDVVAPVVALAKAAGAGFVSRGDTVAYSITLTNGGTSPAYDLSLADVLPAGLSYVPGTTTLTVGGTTTSFTSPNAVTLAMLGSGQTGVVNYQVKVDAAATAAASYTNTATIGYDSLSGPGGRAATSSGTATISTPTNVIALSKSFISTTIPETGTAQFRSAVTDLNVGEHAVIDLTASFTEGTTGNVVITDQLPLTGKFQLVGTPTITFLGGTTATLTGAPVYTDTDGDGIADKVTYTFGTVTVPVDGDPTNNLIRIRYEILTPDVASNVAGAALASPAMLTTAAGNAAATLLADIVAPNVAITKAVSAGTADAGDVKSYSVTIVNNGTGPAFDLTLADTLPPGLTAVAGTTVLTVGGTSTTYASPSAVPLASLGVGQSAVLTFNAVVGDSAVAGSTLTNGATVSYDSLPGIGGHPGSAAATASFTTAAVQTLDKLIVATSETFTGTQMVRPSVTDLTIGERATFELATTFSEGTTNNVVLTDQLVTANGVLTFAGTPTLILGAGITITGSVTPVFIDTNGDGVPDQVRFNLGNVTVPGDNNPSNNFVRIRYDAALGNVATNASGNQLTLPATLSSTSGLLTASAPADIVTPVLTLAKTLAPDQPTDGQHTDFLLTIGHAGTSAASATNVVLTEMLPRGALLAGVTVVGGPAGIVVSGNVITIPRLDIGQTVVIRISTTLDFANTPVGDTINMAGISYGTVSGTTTGGRIGTAASQAILPFGNPTTTLPGVHERQEQDEIGSIGGWLDQRFVEDFPEIDPIYSGSAAPGTSITIDVSDSNGSISGLGTGIADAGGNWLVRLPSTTVNDTINRSRFDKYYDTSRLFHSPNGELFETRSLLGFRASGDRLSVGSQPTFATQVVRVSVGGGSGGFDTTFAPAWRDQFFSTEGLSDAGVFRDRAGDVVEHIFDSLASPEAAGLNRFNREFLTTADF